MRNTRYNRGLTLVELMVALVVTSVVLAAVATLAYALGTAYDAADDTSQKQAQVRYATLRISELIRHCKLVCSATDEDFAIWRADDNEDGQVNISELVFIEKGSGSNRLRLCEFPLSGSDPVVNLSEIGAFSSNWWSAYSSEVNYTVMLPQCSNVQFDLYAPPPPPALPTQSRFVSISFELVENGMARQYQINARLRGWAGNLLNQTGDGLVSSDDD